jgi:hypothetical protein
MHVDVHEMGYNFIFFSSISRWHEYIEKYQKDFHNTLGAKWPRSLMLKIGYITPENDLICFILVMGIPINL